MTYYSSHALLLSLMFFFFFQAEDGIRDYKVTGVQTCALPISAEVGDPLPVAMEYPLAQARGAVVPAILAVPPAPFDDLPELIQLATIVDQWEGRALVILRVRDDDTPAGAVDPFPPETGHFFVTPP